MISLDGALTGVARLGLDTAPIIYFVEAHPRHNLRTPDALQVAAALLTGCQAFLTNDMTLKHVTELSVLALDELSL